MDRETPTTFSVFPCLSLLLDFCILLSVRMIELVPGFIVWKY